MFLFRGLHTCYTNHLSYIFEPSLLKLVLSFCRYVLVNVNVYCICLFMPSLFCCGCSHICYPLSRLIRDKWRFPRQSLKRFYFRVKLSDSIFRVATMYYMYYMYYRGKANVLYGTILEKWV